MNWETIVGLLFLAVLYIFIVIYSKQQEGFDNPETVSYTHQGDIETLRKQIVKITITEESLNVIKEQVKQLTDQASTLQNNLPISQV